jgi:hypothetical protein
VIFAGAVAQLASNSRREEEKTRAMAFMSGLDSEMQARSRHRQQALASRIAAHEVHYPPFEGRVLTVADVRKALATKSLEVDLK